MTTTPQKSRYALLFLSAMCLCSILFLSCSTTAKMLQAGTTQGQNSLFGSGVSNDSLVYSHATFMGGTLERFRNWIYREVSYPEMQLRLGIPGKVYASFIIECDGRLTNIKIISSTGIAFSDEVRRVLQQSPRWEPARSQNGLPVRALYNLPIIFRTK